MPHGNFKPDLEATCTECEQPLEIEVEGNKVHIKPCEICIDRSYNEGQSDGYRSGDEEGYEEGLKNGFG